MVDSVLELCCRCIIRQLYFFIVSYLQGSRVNSIYWEVKTSTYSIIKSKSHNFGIVCKQSFNMINLISLFRETCIRVWNFNRYLKISWACPIHMISLHIIVFSTFQHSSITNSWSVVADVMILIWNAYCRLINLFNHCWVGSSILTTDQ